MRESSVQSTKSHFLISSVLQNHAPIIKNVLDKLGAKDLKSFHFHLEHYTDSEHKPIPRSKLEGADNMDIATLMTNHYSGEVLGVTRDILHKIDQRELVSQVESHMGKKSSLAQF